MPQRLQCDHIHVAGRPSGISGMDRTVQQKNKKVMDFDAQPPVGVEPTTFTWFVELITKEMLYH
jgi:hypothetical protein